MTHREALNLILEKVQDHLEIPADMAENLITTAEMAPRMKEELYLEPLPFIQENYQDLLEIGHKLNTLRPKMEDVPDRKALDRYMAYEEKFDILVNHMLPKLDRKKALEAIPLVFQKLGFCQNQRSRFNPLEAVSYPRDRSDAEGIKDRDADEGKNQLLKHEGYIAELKRDL